MKSARSFSAHAPDTTAIAASSVSPPYAVDHGTAEAERSPGPTSSPEVMWVSGTRTSPCDDAHPASPHANPHINPR
ncbi:MAG: hypothetical protein ACPHRO_02345 [Nannocystaceae bacterium]